MQLIAGSTSYLPRMLSETKKYKEHTYPTPKP